MGKGENSPSDIILTQGTISSERKVHSMSLSLREAKQSEKKRRHGGLQNLGGGLDFEA